MAKMFLLSITLATCLVSAGYTQAQPPQAPPRTMADILSVLDQYKPDPSAVEKLRSLAEAKPPNTTHEQELAIFYHKRARANENIGRLPQQIADLYMARKFALPSGMADREGDGAHNRIRVDLSVAELFGGNWMQAIAISKELLSSEESRIVGYTNLVAAYAAMGDLPSARKAMTDSHNELASLISRGGRYSSTMAWVPLWRLMVARSQTLLLEAEGNFGEAERSWRTQLAGVTRIYDAIAKYRTSTVWAERTLSRILLSWSLSEMLLAKNLRQQGLSAEAEYQARSGLLRLLQALGRYSTYTAGAIGELGWAMYEAGRFSDASALAQAALDSFEKAGTPTDSLLQAEARALRGSSLASQGQWQEAISIFETRDKALSTDPARYAAKNGDDANWGIALLRTGESRKALAMLERLYRHRLSTGLPDTEYFTAQARGFYAAALAADGHPEKALTEFQGALPVLVDDARRNAGGEQGGAVARQMRLVWILEAYLKLLVDLRDSPALKASGLDAAAEAFRIADFARGSAVQRALAESAARATPSDPALAALARREQTSQQRFVTLSDLLNRLLLAPPEQQLPNVIADLRRDIATLRVEREALKVDLDKRFPDYAELVSPRPTTLAQTQAALGSDEALISIYVGAERSYVWAVPKSGRIAFSELSLTEAEARSKVSELRRALDVGEVELAAMPRFDLALSHSLYRTLLQPVEDGWRGSKTLIVVPHRSLGQLPFSMLTTSPFTPSPSADNLFADYRQAPWLLRRAAIVQLPSASTLVALRRMPAAAAGRNDFVGFGDPIFSPEMALATNTSASMRSRFRNLGIRTVSATPITVLSNAPVALPAVSVANSSGLAQLSRLPDTAEEITSIARALRANLDTDVFLGRAASEKNVKSGRLDNHRVVMFATHGLVPGDLNGLTQPALALSAPEVTGNAGEDGLLTMEEVLGLKLNADWVVLSACNTASGDGAGSEAVSGLGKAFFFAGARTLLVSNWPVETVSARLLTTKLFEYQAANATGTRAEALRATMLDLMDNAVPTDRLGSKGYTYAHPMFWAPFSLVGDGGR